MIDPAKSAEQQGTSASARKMPPTFDPAYVQGAVKPFSSAPPIRANGHCFP
jgi:hypothetical protein